ncbi:hypothetical protein KK141_03435 [Dyella sp. LX-66]|uniref:hypothetical protein n=1 Tax=unclassified Dyella TaxID=2634549 RepID=UPI001BE117D1|nr:MULTISPECIES: hypothetical protein [unclassified Dyella]MBT2119369.1 hypothetical protein [Dyella sp. LX-1]MBT2138588.1 hypothetical protein [Dyella sp. LX-66]
MSSIWNDLLFLHGHIADANLARRLAAAPDTEAQPREPARQKEKTARTGRMDVARIAACGNGACTPT